MVDDRGQHAAHDPMLVASLLDDDLSVEERAAAEAAISSCPECLALRDDLLALATATRDLPVPGRSREFTLTAEDAARLQAAAGEEPGAAAARLTREMTGTTTSAGHASHDTILVASLVDGSLPDTERAFAERQIAACGQCAALYADLDALRAATRAMPTPPRPRDYTLTPEVAAGLRPRGWRRWVAAFGSSRDVFSRPLAVGLTTLGLAGLLIANIPSITIGGASSAAAPIANDAAAPATDRVGDVTVSAPEAGGGEPAPGAAAGAPSANLAVPVRGSAQPVPAPPDRTTADGAGASAPRAPEVVTDGSTTGTPGVGKSAAGQGAGGATGGTGSAAPGAVEGATVSPLVLLSGSLLVVGLGLFALRWGARRFGD